MNRPPAPAIPPHRAALDALRGLAALLVVVSHLDNAGMGLLPGYSFSGIGKYGVFLFFTLSAYLLTDALLAKPTAELLTAATWRRYAARRIRRIYPLYVVVLLAGTLLAGSGWVIPLAPREALAHLTLQAGKDVYWSVPVEFKYYLVIPFLALACHGLRRLAPWLAPAAVLGALGLAAGLWPASASVINGIDLGPYLPLFLAGSLVAAVQHTPLPARWRRGHRHAPRFAGLTLVVAALLLVALVPESLRRLGLPVANDVLHRAYPGFALLWAVVLLALPHLRGVEASCRHGRWRWLARVGEASFSLYLLHMSVLLGLLQAGATGPLVGWLALALALAAAFVGERCIERPTR